VQFYRTVEGRLSISVLLVLLLTYGLFQLGMTSLWALDPDGTQPALTAEGQQALLLGFQTVALLTGTLLAGVGHRRGLLFGGIVGVISGLVFLWALLVGLVEDHVPALSVGVLAPDSPNYRLALALVPMAYAFVGALGGGVGGKVWKPLPDLNLTAIAIGKGGPGKGLKGRRRDGPAVNAFSGRIAWPRVVAGTLVAVAGAGSTDRIIDLILRLSEGQLRVTTDQDNLLAYLMVFAFSILTGGFVAGATKANGIKQGLCVGAGAATILAGLFWNGAAHQSVSVAYPIVGTLCLGPIGGWFGGELLPPVEKKKPRNLMPTLP
jgi:hypothetical protein